MSQNGQESEERRKERVMYQRGDDVAKKARHQVQDEIVGRRAEFNAQDVMCALFYMHRQTVAQMAEELAAVIDNSEAFDEEEGEQAREALADKLNEIRSSVGPSDANKD